MKNNMSITNIYQYFNILLDNYNLRKDYNKFLVFLYLYVFTRESFFWLIILTTQSKLQDKSKMFRIIITLFSILILALVFENIYLKCKTIILNSLNECHLKFCFDLINNCKKSEVLKLNLTEQFSFIESVKYGLDNVINERQVTAFLVATFFTVIISSRKINIFLVSGLLVAFNSIIFMIQKKDMSIEEDLAEKNTDNINKIRNYYSDSKQKIINNNFNISYCLDLFKNYYKNNLTLTRIENNLNTYNSISVLLITLIIVMSKYKTSSILDIFVYLLIVYDLDYFVDNLFHFYKIKKSFHKINIHLKNLFQNKEKIKDIPSKKETTIQKLTIKSLENKLPQVTLNQPINFHKGDIVLCNGKSGQGKTTFFKFLKYIEIPDKCEITINDVEYTDFKSIIPNIFLTIQNNKPLYDDSLYNLITNYSPPEKIDSNLIVKLLKNFYLNHIFKGDKDEIVDISKLSGGEQMRLNLCQTLYNILMNDYDLILFDEIDANLDLETAYNIFKNIVTLLPDKILIFIVHNDYLKPIFSKQIMFVDHEMIPNF